MEALCSYLPASILSYLLSNSDVPLKPPFRQTYKTCVLFADVSGFTALCEAMAAKGPGGDEYLAKHLNSYFELLVRTMSSQGGDVFKFAGDAILVLWPPSEEDLTTTARRAGQCALEIKEKLQDVRLGKEVNLNVKVGVGVGEISILHVGGVFGRMEYIATGAPLVQAFQAEHQAVQREVVMSPEGWELVKDYFKADINDTKHAFLKDCSQPIKKVSVFKTTTHGGRVIKTEVLKNVGKYVPSAVLPFINHQEEKWASELRRITVLFVNLGIKETDLVAISSQHDLSIVQNVLEAVQLAVYKYEGSLNKFLMDDKGSTLIAVFGLPPLAHEDDSVRGILSALAICAKLHELGLRPAIGVTTGMAFCGVVGSRGRREYSVLGDTVNLAARLMQHATKQTGGVLCDTATQYAARHRLHFEDMGKITVKGKSKPVSIWQPYPKSLTPLFKTGSNGGALKSSTDPSGKRGSLSEAKYRINPDAAHKLNFQSIRSIFDSFRGGALQGGNGKENNNPDIVKLNNPNEEKADKPLPANSRLIYRRASAEAKGELEKPLPRGPDGSILVPKLRRHNTPRNLMAEIHNFQANGYTRAHFDRMKQIRATAAKLGPQEVAAKVNKSVRLNKRAAAVAAGVAPPASITRTDNTNVDKVNGVVGGLLGVNIDEKRTTPPSQIQTQTQTQTQLQASATATPSVNTMSSNEKPRGVILHPRLPSSTPHKSSNADKPSASPSPSPSPTSPSATPSPSPSPLQGLFGSESDHQAPSPVTYLNGYGSINAFSDPELILSGLDYPQLRSPSPDPQPEIQPVITGIRCILPDAAGSLTISCVSKTTMSEVKEEIWSICQQRSLLPLDAAMKDYWFVFEDNDNKIPDELPIQQLPTMQSARARKSALITLCFLKGGEEFRTDQMRKHKDILLDRINTLLTTKKGGTLIIEGDIGLGKSRLLYSTINETPAHVLCGAGNPFEMNRPLSVWRDIFLQIIDSEIEKVGSEVYKDSMPANRRLLIESKLKLKRSFGRESLDVLAPVLNEVLQLDYPESDVTQSMDAGTRIAHAHSLLLVLMQMFSSHHPLIVVIDDAVFLDQRSWALVYAMHRQVEGLLLILATRPINKSYMAAFATSVPEEYTFLLRDPSTTLITILPRPDEVIYQIACECLGEGIDEIPAHLAHLILRKAHGNPLVVKELVYALKKDKLIVVDGLKVTLSKELQATPLNANPNMPVPITLQGILGCRIDRLTHIQRMILKVASIIGDDFSYAMSEKVYPLALEGEESFQVEIDNLCELNILKQIDTPENAEDLEDQGLPQHKKVYYTFTNGFMREMLLSRMLNYQKKRLTEKMNEIRLERLKKRSENIKIKPTLTHNIMLLEHRGKPSEVWTRRFFGVQQDMLMYWLTEEAWTRDQRPPHSIIYLKEATLNDGDDSKDLSFVVTCQTWMEAGDYQRVTREYHLAFDSAAEWERWGNALFQQLQPTESTKNVSKKLSETMIKIQTQIEIEAEQHARSELSEENIVPQKVLQPAAMSRQEREVLEKKFIQSAERREPKVLLQAYLFVRKQGTSLFSRDWKRRWVMLTDDCICFHANKPKMPAPRPAQTLSLAVGAISVYTQGYDSNQRVHVVNLEVDLWMKRSTTSWERRKVKLGCSSSEEASNWCEQIKLVIKNTQAQQHNKARHRAHQRSATWGPKKGSGILPSPIHDYNNYARGSSMANEQHSGSPDNRNVSADEHTDMGMNIGNITTPLNNKSNTTLIVPTSSSMPTRSILNVDADTPGHEDAPISPSGRVKPRAATGKVTRLPATAPSSISVNALNGGANTHLHTTTSTPMSSSLLDDISPSSDDLSRPSVTSTRASISGRRLRFDTMPAVDEEKSNTNKDMVMSLINRAIDMTDSQDISPEQIKSMLLSLKTHYKAAATQQQQQQQQQAEQTQHSQAMTRVTQTAAAPSFVQMVNACDIDNQTKEWLAVNYTQEKVPAFDHKQALSPRDAPTPSPARPIAMYQSLDLGNLKEWEWDIFSFEPAELLPVLVQLFSYFHFFDTYKIPADTFTRFIRQVRKSYLDNPFHNFYHAVDVTQTVFSLLVAMGGEPYLTQLEKFAILIAAFCHDLRHPGLNNTYQVNAQTPLALLYNDQSVLEHHHCASTFRILTDPEYNILQGLRPDEYRAVRACLTTGILATDMTCHFVLIEKFNTLLDTMAKPDFKRGPPGSDASTWLSDADRSVIFNVLLHSADISNSCKPWAVGRRWSDLVLKEFFHQGDVEKAQNLPVSPNSDRETTDQAQLCLNFTDFIVAPIFVSVRQLLPAVQKCCTHLKDNRNDWAKIYSKKVEESNRSRAEKAQEKARWIRRTESFHEIMLPPEHKSGPSHSRLSHSSSTSGSGSVSGSVSGSGSHPSRRNSILVLEKFVRANSRPTGTGSYDANANANANNNSTNINNTQNTKVGIFSSSSSHPHSHSATSLLETITGAEEIDDGMMQEPGAEEEGEAYGIESEP